MKTNPRFVRFLFLVSVFAVSFSLGANAYSQAYGRIAFFAQSANTTDTEGNDSLFQEYVTTLTLQSGEVEQGFEYAADLRLASYPTEEENRRISIYNAYVGRKFNSHFGVRGGQMWLNELGALGSLGGFVAQVKGSKKSYGQFRIGGFGGLEPENLDVGYVTGITKFGGYFALDGDRGRSHVISYVNVRNSGQTERSTIVLTNFLPVGNDFFMYQAAEIDTYGVDKESLGMNYFFTNARYTLMKKFEIQGAYHHGRSIDFRTLTLDQINGRPITDSDTRGLLFESSEGRFTYLAGRGLRLYVGYGVDRSNEGEDLQDRLTTGFYSADLFHSGVDAQLSVSRRKRDDGSGYNTWNAAVGRMVSSKVYINGEYTSSLSILRFVGDDSVIVFTRPSSRRYSLSSMFYLSRAFTVMLTGEHTTADTVKENRLLGGITYRF
ncbi:MAG TPA: hypothetical protein VLH08_14710 [Acidobacteriota bacterium]|nr:hypothetical protein [Acidobacteriota bacterium]